MGSVEVRSGRGIINTISISNTIKIIPSKKNRKENGIRAVFLGSNPHSNGDVFSRSDEERALKNHAAANVADDRTEATTEAIEIRVTNWK